MLPVGSPAIGDDFIDREKEIKYILATMEKDSILLIAPRRFGKTSIMRKLKELLDPKGISAFLEVEDVYSPQRFISEIIMALIENEKISKKYEIISTFKNGFRWFTENIEELETPVFKAKLRSNIEIDLKEDWIEKSRNIFEIISRTNEKIYFIIDEFSVAIKNIESKEAEKFLHWFRKLRQVNRNLRFVVGGSVSIDRVVRDVGGVNTINDFNRIKIGGFQRDIAVNVIEKVFKEEDWPYKESHAEEILACIGEAYIPYFIAIMLSAIKEEKNLRGEEINEKLMKKVCSVDYYPIDIAFGIFKQTTEIEDYEKFIDLIADLSNDFYIEYDTKNGLKFYSKMLKDWWRVYYGNDE